MVQFAVGLNSSTASHKTSTSVQEKEKNKKNYSIIVSFANLAYHNFFQGG
jgi:hypothetical protein